jgi:FO synthase
MSADEVLDVARAGAAAGCREALFTLGDKPELRYRAARDELAELGCATTIEYLVRMCRLVLDETGLLPHANPGVMSRDELASLRAVTASQGIMLETISDRLSERGGPHFGSPDKTPSARLETLRLAGELRIPFTTGILLGIGETRRERVESLLAIRRLHREHGHIQEVIVQNFRAMTGTPMALAPEPDEGEVCHAVALARLVLDPEVSLQAPPNLNPASVTALIGAGINDLGGISPVTPDYINPRHPWPHLDALGRECARAGFELAPRLPIYDRYVDEPGWLDEGLRPYARKAA